MRSVRASTKKGLLPPARPASWRRFARDYGACARGRINARDAAEIIENCCNLIGRKLNLRHVTVLRAHAFAKTLFQLVDWVFEVNLPQRRCLWQGTFAACPKRMAAAAIVLENGLALASCSVCRRLGSL